MVKVKTEGSTGGPCHTTHRAEFNQVRLVSWQVRASRARDRAQEGGLEAASKKQRNSCAVLL